MLTNHVELINFLMGNNKMATPNRFPIVTTSNNSIIEVDFQKAKITSFHMVKCMKNITGSIRISGCMPTAVDGAVPHQEFLENSFFFMKQLIPLKIQQETAAFTFL